MTDGHPVSGEPATNVVQLDSASKKSLLLKIDKRLSRAFASANKLEEDGFNNHLRNKYVSAQQVKAVVRAALCEAGLHLDGCDVEILDVRETKTKNGDPEFLVSMRARIFILGREFQGIGAGKDRGADAWLKAQTYAVREALKNMLCLSTEEVQTKDLPQDERMQALEGTATDPRAARTKGPEDFVIEIGQAKGQRVGDQSDAWLIRVLNAPQSSEALKAAASAVMERRKKNGKKEKEVVNG